MDPELRRALTELLEQAASEPVSPRLRELAQQLEEALASRTKDRDR